MKKIIYVLPLVTLVTLSPNSYAVGYQPGPYLGGQLGWGRLYEGDGYIKYLNSLGTPQIERGTFTGWRVYGGYNFVPFFSIEAGYSHYPTNTYTLGSTALEIKAYTIDVVGKISLPLGTLMPQLACFSLYGKGGGAYVDTTVTTLNSLKRTNQAIRPTYGAGIVFNVTDNITIDASWTSVLGRNRITASYEVATKDPVPTSHLFTLGLAYKITGIF